MDDVPRRLHRSAAHASGADHAVERAPAHAGMGVPTGQTQSDQGDADSLERRGLRDNSRQRVGDRRTVGARSCGSYTYPANDGFHIGHRGAAVYKDSVFLTTPDAHLVALDARNGTSKWNVVIADSKRGYWSTNAPLLIRNHLLVGVVRRLRQSARHPQVDRSGNRRDAMDVLQHAASGTPRSTERRRDRRTNVDDRHLRSAS